MVVNVEKFICIMVINFLLIIDVIYIWCFVLMNYCSSKVCYGFDGIVCVGEGLKNGGFVEFLLLVGGFEFVIDMMLLRFGFLCCERGFNWV